MDMMKIVRFILEENVIVGIRKGVVMVLDINSALFGFGVAFLCIVLFVFQKPKG